MRTMLKVDGKWVTEQAPDSAQDLSKWLWAHDGEEAVVADDQGGIYYCGNESVLQFYRSNGKTARMFIVLDDRLRSGT
ncbi:hypothetical protein [Geomonas subterranea]|uniref:hypothetical protein n=1 Tax=Geomonas subterranea TaxID=2847989 RepID=UPI001CD4C8FD|nr:hypothetical protein [Geomonas fuzhouensis]